MRSDAYRALFKQVIILVLALMLSSDLWCQRFDAGFVLGLNAAQVDGDANSGYNKLGINSGLMANAILNSNWKVGIELLYSERGSQSEIGGGSTIEQRKIALQYASIPILVRYLDWQKDDYHVIEFHGGVSYGRLLNAKIQDSSSEPLIDFFTKNDISAILGATFNLNESLGLQLRWNSSINLLFDNNNNPSINSNSLRSYFLSFRVTYKI